MPQPNKRSRTFRRVFIKTPGNNNRILYKNRKPKQPHCDNCGKILHGTKRGGSALIRNLSKSNKHPARIFGGKLCSTCTKRELIKRIRK